MRSAKLRPVFKWFFCIFFLDCIVLGYIGAKPPEGAFIIIGQVATFWYFFHLVILLPLIGILERPEPIPESISTAVID